MTPANPKLENRLGESLSGAQIIWEALVREGVEVCFGYPGGAIMPAYDAMIEYPIHHVLTRHEQGASHMADGYARASGKSAFVLRLRARRNQPRDRHRDRHARLGPDGLHHRAGPLAAHRQRCVPGDRHHGLHHSGHQAQLPGDETGANRADHPRGVLHRPLRPAGPVVVDITKDAQQQSCVFEWNEDEIVLPGYRPDYAPLAEQLEEAP